MNNRLLTWLLSTGLDQRRAELHLVALTLGEALAADLAKKIQFSQTAIYASWKSGGA